MTITPPARPATVSSLTVTRLPVKVSADPRDNPPAAAGVLIGVLVAVLAATDGRPVWVAVAAYAVIVAGMVAAQALTVPLSDLLGGNHGPDTHADPPQFYAMPPAGDAGAPADLEPAPTRRRRLRRPAG